MDAITEIMTALHTLTDKALDAAKVEYKSESYRGGLLESAVNWADLNCVDVEYVRHLEGDPFYRVRIEEASPSSYNLRVYVAEFLKKSGHSGVVVSTEW